MFAAMSPLILGRVVMASIFALVPAAAAFAADSTHVEFPSRATLRIVDGPTLKGEEHYDPHRSGNPLLDVAGANRELKLSKNFTAGELAKSGATTVDIARIDPELVKCLQAIRDHVGKPVIVTSGYRSYERNRAVYEGRGEEPTDSRHLSGQAADIRVEGLSGMEIAKAAIDSYGSAIGVGIGGRYAHIDVRGKWAKWTYFEDDANDKALAEIQKYRDERAPR